MITLTQGLLGASFCASGITVLVMGFRLHYELERRRDLEHRLAVANRNIRTLTQTIMGGNYARQRSAAYQARETIGHDAKAFAECFKASPANKAHWFAPISLASPGASEAILAGAGAGSPDTSDRGTDLCDDPGASLTGAGLGVLPRDEAIDPTWLEEPPAEKRWGLFRGVQTDD